MGSTTIISTSPPLVLAFPSSTPTDEPPAPTSSPTAVQSPTPAPTAGIPELQDAAIQKQIDQLATWFLNQGTNSALGVAIAERDPRTGQLGAMMLNYGTTAKGAGQTVTSDTIYEIGSITKVFTGILLAEQVDAGAVRLDDPIQNYLPEGIEAPTYKQIAITLDDLATHRSGLPRDVDTDSIRELYGWLNGYHLNRAPGVEYAYSNVGFSLLGDILARRAGTDFNTLEYQSVSKPLGLSDTIEALTSDQTNRLAQGYTYDGSAASYFPDSGAMSAAGYMHSTLKDMTSFLVDNMQANSTQLGDSLQMAQSLQAEGKEPGTGVGLGWEIDQLGTTSERLYKGGGTYGFTSYISFLRDNRYGFVLLTNGMYAENLVPHMLNILNTTP